MNKTFVLRIFLLFGCCFHSFGQRCNYKLEGFVYDSKSNKPLFGANIWIEKYSKGVSSREDGSFVLSELCDSKFDLKAHFIGYSEVSISPYYQRIEDFIFLDQQPNLKLTIRGAFLEYQYAQADARFSGLDAFLQFKPSKRWTIEGKYSKVDAINLENKDPLPFIPTDKLSTDIKLSLNDTKRLKNSEIRLSFEHVWEASSKNTEVFTDFINHRFSYINT